MTLSCLSASLIVLLNFNPHLPRGRWLNDRYNGNLSDFISIHTFLAEGDQDTKLRTTLSYIFQSTPSSRKVTFLHRRWHSLSLISIHTFLAEGDVATIGVSTVMTDVFQSTPSSRKVTNYLYRYFASWFYFNPHLPRGRWRSRSNARQRKQALISIHTFLAEGDFAMPTWTANRAEFQSTPSLRKVTWLR